MWVPRVALLIGLAAITSARGLSTRARDCSQLPASNAPAAQSNDNRTPAGTLKNGVLTLRLELQHARWYPEGETGCGIGMYAFGEEGKAAQTPAPLIRVPVGAELRVSVRNNIDLPIQLRGLQDRARDGAVDVEPVEIAAGATREFVFRATTPGTFYYYATGVLATNPRFVPAAQFSQAVGALVVDAPGIPLRDRVFVMTRWRGPPNSAARRRAWELTAFNGRSWPHTERISATVGDTLRWRVIAANNDGHMMHLHGFYFHVESRGHVNVDSVFASAEQPLRVTEGLAPGGTMAIRWIPERAGNWIFHCHLMRHMSAAQRIDRMVDTTLHGNPAGAHASHALHQMAGLVLGINVQPAAATRATSAAPAPRALRLFANQRERVFGAHPGYGFVLQEGQQPPARDSVRLPGAPLILTRGERVQITVFNRLNHSLAVHWHGIEVDSYVDGVAGWSGAPGRIAPPIAAGDSFVVGFTPPRAGTFIYHVHNEAAEELPSGLYGALIVLEPGAHFDPAIDRLFIISEPGPGNPPIGQMPFPPFINGSATPPTMELVAGRTYRLRFIIISADDAYRIELRQGDVVEQWRKVAHDGADIPVGSTRLVPALVRGVGTGSTFDFAFTPASPGDLTLEVDPLGPPGGQPIGKPTKVPIGVRAR